MDWTASSAIIGAFTGILSLVGIIYMLGYKLSSIETRLNLIWSVFVEDALRQQVRRGNLSHSSPDTLSRSLTSEQFIGNDLVHQLSKKSHLADHQLALEIISTLGFDFISKYSMEHEMTTQEYVAMCVVSVRSLN